MTDTSRTRRALHSMSCAHSCSNLRWAGWTLWPSSRFACVNAGPCAQPGKWIRPELLGCCQTKSPQRLVVVASVYEQPVPLFQWRLAGGHPSGRDDVRGNILRRCATSRICWPSVASISAMRPSGSGGTGLAQYSPPRSARRRVVHISAYASGAGIWMRCCEGQRQALLSLARRRP